MISFSERVVNDMPIITVTINVTDGEELDVDALRTRWNKMYTDYPIFTLELDATQIGVISGMTLLPSIISIAKATRELSKKQVFYTGIALPWLASFLIEIAKEQYPPVRPIIQAETTQEMQRGIEQILWDPRYRNPDGSWSFEAQ